MTMNKMCDMNCMVCSALSVLCRNHFSFHRPPSPKKKNLLRHGSLCMMGAAGVLRDQRGHADYTYI